MYKQPLTRSREQWFERGRFVCVPNSEAKDVIGIHAGPGVYSARHVFTEDQTVLVEQFQSEAA